MNRMYEIKDELARRNGLKCAITGFKVESIDNLDIDYIISFEDGGTENIENMRLVLPNVNIQFSENHRKSRLVAQQLQERRDELERNEKKVFEREHTYRQQIDNQKMELDHYRNKLHSEQADREMQFFSELEEKRSQLRAQEAHMVSQMQMVENKLKAGLSELEGQKIALSNENHQQQLDLQLSYDDLEKDKIRYTEENQKRVEKNATNYVNDALSSLDTASTKHQKYSRYWSYLGVTSLVLGAGVAAFFGLNGLSDLPGAKPLEWAHVVFYSFKGIVLIALFVALAKYCFMYSQSFMHESLKGTERQHAIKFGKFYLESYGANADWGQIKEAFEHWNISPPSAF